LLQQSILLKDATERVVPRVETKRFADLFRGDKGGRNSLRFIGQREFQPAEARGGRDHWCDVNERCQEIHLAALRCKLRGRKEAIVEELRVDCEHRR
jgi:hypothetical protein